jgi:hypothetical protein
MTEQEKNDEIAKLVAFAYIKLMKVTGEAEKTIESIDAACTAVDEDSNSRDWLSEIADQTA